MNLTWGNKLIKNILAVFNFIFVITGIIILAVGVSVRNHYAQYSTFLDDKYFSLPNMLIATGSLIFIISLLGCLGAMRENWLMLMAFSVLLGIIFIFELSVGIAGYVLRNKTSSYLKSTLNDSMHVYGKNPAMSGMWDTIQEEFTCCGVTSLKDWHDVFENYSLPVSCCPRTSAVGVFYCNSYIDTVSTTTVIVATTTPESITSTTTTLAPNSPQVNILADGEDDPTGEETDSTTSTTEQTTDESAAPTDVSQSTTTTVFIDPTTITTTTTITPNITDIPTQSPTTSTILTDTTPITSTTSSGTTTNITPSTAYPPSSSKPYYTGCAAAFGNFVEKHAVDIGGVGIALAVIQLFGIFFSFYLARQLKNGYYST